MFGFVVRKVVLEGLGVCWGILEELGVRWMKGVVEGVVEGMVEGVVGVVLGGISRRQCYLTRAVTDELARYQI